jgi:hypothetical protein
MYEDQAFFSKVYLKEVAFVSAACNNKYRQRPASLVSSVHTSGKYNVVRDYYLNWFENFLRMQEKQFPEVLALLAMAKTPSKKTASPPLTARFPARIRNAVAKTLVRLGLITHRKIW